MHREGPSSIFTIYFNGQFWVGTIERIEGSELSAAHVVFGAEPSNERALQFVIEKWGELRFSPEAKTERKKGIVQRGQREAALAAAKAMSSTKAQQAIAKIREQNKAAAQKESAAVRRGLSMETLRESEQAQEQASRTLTPPPSRHPSAFLFRPLEDKGNEPPEAEKGSPQTKEHCPFRLTRRTCRATKRLPLTPFAGEIA